MVQDAKTRSRLRVTLCCTYISCHVAILLCLRTLRNYQQENCIISFTCTSGVIKNLQVLFTEQTVSRNHYLSCSQVFSPKQAYIYISTLNNQCKCCGPLQSSHLKNRYVTLFTHTALIRQSTSQHSLNLQVSHPCTQVSCSETINLTPS
jgi:hypothetical protein